MKYYILKPTTDITQADLNLSGARDLVNVRKSTTGLGIMEASEEVAATQFAEYRWLSLEEARVEMQKPEWNGEDVGLLSKALAFFKARKSEPLIEAEPAEGESILS